MFSQLRYFAEDYTKAVGKVKLRYFTVWMTQSIIGIGVYRFERGMFLALGIYWKYLRILILPLLELLYAYSNCQINYGADIGPGLKILHPNMGIVVTIYCKIGKEFAMTGGNAIGGKTEGKKEVCLFIGDNCSVGINALVLGPGTIGNHVLVGAGAIVTKSFPDEAILVGMPAKDIRKRDAEGNPILK